MNYTDTLQSVKLVLAAGAVPLLIGNTGIGKTALATEVAEENGWTLIDIDGNILKEGEIGGLPTVENGTTVYAIHHKLKAIDDAISQGKTVLLFIDEINRCEHAVQQELMNLILNHEINGYHLSHDVRIIAAMNPTDTYDYQTIEMDDAQKNRFVWLYMEPDYMQWLDWAAAHDIEPKVMEFISTFPDYLSQQNEDDINATPRSYERISSILRVYEERRSTISKAVFYNVICGNVGKVIAQEFVNFIESDATPLISYDDVFGVDTLSQETIDKIENESHTRLYLAAKNMLRRLDTALAHEEIQAQPAIDRLVEYLHYYPVDLMIGIMKEIRNNTKLVGACALENDSFVEAYFQTYESIG